MGGCRWIEGGGQLVCTESGRGLHLVLFVCFLVSRLCLPSFDPESFYVPTSSSSLINPIVVQLVRSAQEREEEKERKRRSGSGHWIVDIRDGDEVCSVSNGFTTPPSSLLPHLPASSPATPASVMVSHPSLSTLRSRSNHPPLYPPPSRILQTSERSNKIKLVHAITFSLITVSAFIALAIAASLLSFYNDVYVPHLPLPHHVSCWMKRT